MHSGEKNNISIRRSSVDSRQFRNFYFVLSIAEKIVHYFVDFIAFKNLLGFVFSQYVEYICVFCISNCVNLNDQSFCLLNHAFWKLILEIVLATLIGHHPEMFCTKTTQPIATLFNEIESTECNKSLLVARFIAERIVSVIWKSFAYFFCFRTGSDENNWWKSSVREWVRRCDEAKNERTI